MIITSSLARIIQAWLKNISDAAGSFKAYKIARKKTSTLSLFPTFALMMALHGKFLADIRSARGY